MKMVNSLFAPRTLGAPDLYCLDLVIVKPPIKDLVQKTSNNISSGLSWCKLNSEIRTTSLQGRVDLMCPLLKDPNVLVLIIILIYGCNFTLL